MATWYEVDVIVDNTARHVTHEAGGATCPIAWPSITAAKQEVAQWKRSRNLKAEVYRCTEGSAGVQRVKVA